MFNDHIIFQTHGQAVVELAICPNTIDFLMLSYITLACGILLIDIFLYHTLVTVSEVSKPVQYVAHESHMLVT